MPKEKMQPNILPEEVKKNYTDEFIMLGILSIAKNLNQKLDRLQLTKILQKFKQRMQEEFRMEAYHPQFTKQRHGDYTEAIYPQLSDLKQSDFIESIGTQPYEKFYSTEYGDTIFSKVRMNSGEGNEKLDVVRDILERIVKVEALKTPQQLEAENHARKVIIDGREMTVEEAPIGVITTPTITTDNVFVFDDNSAIDWDLHRKIAISKRQRVLPENQIPKNQEEVYELLGI